MGYSKKLGGLGRTSSLKNQWAEIHKDDPLLGLLEALAARSIDAGLVSAASLQTQVAVRKAVHEGFEFCLICRSVETLNRLSDLEKRFAQLAADGLGNKEIARKTQKSLGTVKSALKSVFLKLGIERRGGLKLFFLK